MAGDFEPERVRRLVVRLEDGSERVWWLRSGANVDGVTFELRDARGDYPQTLRARSAAGLN